MGTMVNGVWDDDPAPKTAKDGAFVRDDSIFRDRIAADGSSGFAAEPGRYTLFSSPSCPWAHRTAIFRKLKGLEDVIALRVSDRPKEGGGWAYSQGIDGMEPTDGVFRLSRLYTAMKSDYSGKITVPTLWDSKTNAIVNNESAEIIRMFNSEFGVYGDNSVDYCPEDLRPEIDEINARIYTDLNNGVYRAGFSKTQEAYEEACRKIFACLDMMEERLSRQRYLVGARLTEADWRAYPTLLRFDLVYYSHFKCNLRRIADYPNLSNYLRELYQVPGVKETANFEGIKRGYYGTQLAVNPTGIVPLGPAVDFDAAQDRDRFKKAA